MFFLILFISLFLCFKGIYFAFFVFYNLIILVFFPVSFINRLILCLCIFFILRLVYNIVSKPGNSFDMYFGVPGSGKTTIAAYLALKRLKKGKRVFSNVPLKGCFQISKGDLGVYDISNSLLIMDEISFDFDNRNFRTNFTKEIMQFFKLHRHYNVDVALFSQQWEDPDKKLRDLTTRIFVVDKSFIPFLIKVTRISKDNCHIDKNTRQIVDGYKKVLFGGFYIFSPKLWKCFNSYDRPVLKEKDWVKW